MTAVEPRTTAEVVEYAEHILQLLDQAPPLTVAQKVKLSALLRPAVRAAGRDGMTRQIQRRPSPDQPTGRCDRPRRDGP